MFLREFVIGALQMSYNDDDDTRLTNHLDNGLSLLDAVRVVNL